MENSTETRFRGVMLENLGLAEEELISALGILLDLQEIDAEIRVALYDRISQALVTLRTTRGASVHWGLS